MNAPTAPASSAQTDEIRRLLHERIRAMSQEIALSRNQDLPRAGDGDYLYILLEGILRIWLLDPLGNDITDSFIWKPWQVVSTVPHMTADDIAETVTALSNARLLRIPVEEIRALCASDEDFARIYLEHMRGMYRTLWEHKTILMTLDASARYQWFLERYPGMISAVRHKHIASFLGMTPVSLSRIRGYLKRGEDGEREDANDADPDA